MDHILQVAFSFDDEAVKKRLEEQCFNEVVGILCKEFKRVATEDYEYNGYCSSWNLTEDAKLANRFAQLVGDTIDNRIDKLLASMKDEIIERAAGKLADRLSRTKKAKEILSDA